MLVWRVRYTTSIYLLYYFTLLSWQNLVLGPSQSTFMSDVTKENFLFQERLISFILLLRPLLFLLYSILLSIFMSELSKEGVLPYFVN